MREILPVKNGNIIVIIKKGSEKLGTATFRISFRTGSRGHHGYFVLFFLAGYLLASDAR